jgi:hypothetical protein
MDRDDLAETDVAWPVGHYCEVYPVFKTRWSNNRLLRVAEAVSIGSAATSAANNISRRRASKTPVSGDSTEPSLVTHGELHSSTTR